MSEEKASEQEAESVVEIPEAGSAPVDAVATASKFAKWPLAAGAAAVVIAGFGGYAIGDRNDFDGRPVGVTMVTEDGVMGEGLVMPNGGQDMGHGKGHGKGHHMGHGQGMMPGQDTDGDLTPATPHCHDANGMDQLPGADGLCADGSTPGGPKTRIATPAPVASTAATPSATATS